MVLTCGMTEQADWTHLSESGDICVSFCVSTWQRVSLRYNEGVRRTVWNCDLCLQSYDMAFVTDPHILEYLRRRRWP